MSDNARKKAEKNLNRMPIELTGARKNEMLIGEQNVVKSAILTVINDIPPTEKEVIKIKEYDDLWNKFLVKLGGIEFFSNMKTREREKWIIDNMKKTTDYLDDDKTYTAKIITLGTRGKTKKTSNNFFKLLEEEKINQLSSNSDHNYTIAELAAMFPRKPGSRAKHATLSFNKNYWRIYSSYKQTCETTLPVIDVESGKFYKNGLKVGSSRRIIILDNIGYSGTPAEIGFAVSTNSNRLKPEDFLEGPEYKLIKKACKNFTPAAYKSLLQKLIRFRPEKIKLLSGKTVNAEIACKIVFVLLAAEPGSFVPDIQRYVSGLESASKRLAVAILEDSSIAVSKQNMLVSLLSAAVLKQRVKNWQPTSSLFKKWINVAEDAFNMKQAYSYDRENLVPLKWSEAADSPLILSSLLLDQARSFQGDLNMVRKIAKNNGKVVDSNNFKVSDKIMPIEHCVDQHWAPNIVYFYNPDFIEPVLLNNSKPFSKLFNRLFKEVTGINFRKGDVLVKSDFLTETRRAQRLVLYALQTDSVELAISSSIRQLKFDIPKSWIAAAVGPVDISGSPPVLVTLDTYDLRPIVIRRPGRDTKELKIGKVRKAEALKKFRDILQHDGLPLKNTSFALLNRGKLFIKNDQYVIDAPFLPNCSIDKLHGLKANLPILSKNKVQEEPIKAAIGYTGKGIIANSDKEFRKLIKGTDPKILLKVSQYLGSHKQEIKMRGVNRDGGALTLHANIDDIRAFGFLCKMAIIYPLSSID